MHKMLALAPACVVLIVLPGISFYFDITPKVSVLLIFTAIALLFWRGDLPFGRASGKLFLFVGVAQVVSLCIATLYSTNSSLSFNGGNWRRFGLVTQVSLLVFGVLVVSGAAGRAKRIETYLRVLAVSGILLSAYGIAQYCGFDPLFSSGLYRFGEGPAAIVRPPGTVGHASYFATVLLYTTFAGVALARSASRAWRMTGRLGAILSTLMIVLTGTRAGVLAVLAGFIVLFCWRQEFKSTRYGWAIAAGAAITLGIFWLSPLGVSLRHRVNWSMQEPLGGARPLLWRDSASMALQHPLTGFGPETFGTDFPRYESAALARLYPDFVHESPHNMFLDAFTTQGLPGLLIALALCLCGFIAANEIRGAHFAAPALTAALVAGIVAQQFTSFIIPTALLFILTIAMLVAMPEPSPARVRYPAMVRTAAYACAVLFCIFAIRLSLFDHMLLRSSNAVAAGNLRQGLTALREAEQFRSAGSGADLYFSRRLNSLAQQTPNMRLKLTAFPAAFNTGAAAVDNDENKQEAYFNLAELFAIRHDSLNVERCLRSAIAWAPQWYKPHWALAGLLSETGHNSDARQEASLAAFLSGNDNGEVTRSLAQLRASF